MTDTPTPRATNQPKETTMRERQFAYTNQQPEVGQVGFVNIAYRGEGQEERVRFTVRPEGSGDAVHVDVPYYEGVKLLHAALNGDFNMDGMGGGGL